ncbi:anti-sigma B factor antagonist [Evansella caseinilytica]|uniref:Anti-sigma factor antagonist n=1 Tax=Evansella caseinilytica TaxID=1503961 RepID=A0A1H3QID8_9BACI|nr:STAS domain-containing protein [Evansella caseinilytica]SDZ13292.1 anti-sigma B factor antagonist [Evansella caseinilytica]
MNLSVNVQEEQGTAVVYLAGEVDVYTAPALKETLLPLTEQSSTTVIVNLSDVTYIDSTGLGIFIGALKSSGKAGSKLKITGANVRVKRLFTITGLNEVLDIEEDQREEV